MFNYTALCFWVFFGRSDDSPRTQEVRKKEGRGNEEGRKGDVVWQTHAVCMLCTVLYMGVCR